MLNAIEQAVIATDIAGKIAYWNEAAEALYGWSADEVRGRNVTDVTPASVSREQAARIMATLAAGEIWSGVFPVRDRSGRQFEAAVTDLPILQHGKVVGVLGVSKEDVRASPLPVLLAEFARAAERVWPRQIRMVVGRGLDTASATVGDPHVLQLLALVAMRDLQPLDQGETLELDASVPSKAVVAQFGVAIPAGRCAYIRVRHGSEQRMSALTEAMRVTSVESRYAATLVGLAGGRLFADATPAAGNATHLFLPIGI